MSSVIGKCAIGSLPAVMWCWFAIVTLSSESFAQSTSGPSIPPTWGNLPPPQSIVHLDTPFGAFEMPMGYLSNWYVFGSQPVVTTTDGKRVFSGNFSIQFAYPDGAFDLLPSSNVEVGDDWNSSDTDRSVVLIYGAAPLGTRGRPEQVAEALDLYAPGQLHLEPLIGDPKKNPVYRGVAAGTVPGYRGGVMLGCVNNCGLETYMEHRKLVFHGLIAGRFRNQALAIAAKVQDFFEAWRVTKD